MRQDIPWVGRRPSEIIRSQVRLATQPMADIRTQDFVRLVEMIDAEDVFLFSTDYPHYDADSAENTLPPSMPADLRANVRFRNAIETFPRLASHRDPASP